MNLLMVIDDQLIAGKYLILLQKTLEAFIIILGFFELLYFLSLHSGTILGEKYGPTYNTTNTTNVPAPIKGTAAAAV
jgi:cellobiose-specific phosphotransferase system component IIC